MASLWRVEEAAEYLGIRPKTLYEWVRLDRVPYRKIGFNVRFDPDELARWTAKQARGTDSATRSSQAERVEPETLTTLFELASDASAALRELERDVGASLSFPQRRRLLELAEGLEQAVSKASS